MGTLPKNTRDEITFERFTGRTSMAGWGLIADYYQTILGQVNKEKRGF